MSPVSLMCHLSTVSCLPAVFWIPRKWLSLIRNLFSVTWRTSTYVRCSAVSPWHPGGGYGPHLTCHVAATARDRVGAPGVAGAHALALPHGRNPVPLLLD